MNANIEDFKSKKQPKYKLRKYNSEIIYLIEEGYTQLDVLEYLKTYYKLDVSRPTLSKHLTYLKSQKKETRVNNKKNESSKKEIDNEATLERIKKL